MALADGQRVAIRDSSAVFDANEIGVTVSNLGWFVTESPSSPFYGLEWPRGSHHSAVFTGGLWLGARVGTDTLVTVAEYSSEWAAGPLDGSGSPVDPQETDPAHHLYSIRRCDNATSNTDWASWPSSLGAPHDAAGAPRLLGDQTLWCVYNDALLSHHTNPVGSTQPLGVEVRQTMFGFDRGGNLDRALFLTFDLHNHGGQSLDSAYVALWVDADLGGFTDDLVGCDTTLDLGFTYNGSDNDLDYGAHAPAVGCALLQGPVVNGDTLRMTSFGRLIKNWNEPRSRGSAYRRMVRGLPDPDSPPPFPCDTPGTSFEVSGDPVSGTGCRDTLMADRRMMLSTGPFTLAPGDSQTVVALVAVGGLPGQGDRLSNLTQLRETVREARDAFRSGFASVPAAPACDARLAWTSARPNPARDLQRIELVVGDDVRRLEVRVHDLAGRRIWSRVFSDPRPGRLAIDWDGTDDDGRSVPAGIYLVRVEDGRRRAGGKIVRLR